MYFVRASTFTDLKDYVEGLDANQLKAGIWGGDIGLRNLRLKKGALDKFRLPVDVVEGFIGNLSIKITWSLVCVVPLVHTRGV